jgi:uncharacterized protein (UPF0548 family)
MFLFSKPTDAEVHEFLLARGHDPFSYPEVGATRTPEQLSKYNIDHNRQLLGTGDEAFERAKQAIRQWRMFDFPWVQLVSTATPIQVGVSVAIVVEHFGFYSLNAARIVYAIDDPDRFGFAYGTLSEHGEIGEERFSVELLSSGEVWYDLYAFSRPGAVLAKLGYPLGRRLQKRFARDSKVAMLEAVRTLR